MNSAAPAHDTKGEHLEFSLARELVRIPYYCSIGMVILTIGAWTSWQRDPNELGFHPSWFLLVLVIVAVPALFAVHSWRLRLDDVGIHLRRLRRWRSLLWADIEQGRVTCTGYGYELRVKNNPKYFQSIVLRNVGAKRLEELLPILEKHWQVPDIEPLSKTIRVRFEPKAKFLRPARITPDGIDIHQRGERSPIAWNDIDMVTIWKQSHMHQDFWKLEFSIGDKKLMLIAQATRTWQGVRPESIESLLRSRIPHERILSIGLDDQPRSKSEYTQKEEHLKNQLRKERLMRVFMPLLYATFGVIYAIYGRWQYGPDAFWSISVFSCMVAAFGSLAGLMFGFRIRNTTQEIRKLESTRKDIS